MIRISKLKMLDGKKINFKFSDDTEKTIDFSPFIGENKLSNPLSDPAYFQKVELYENGRGIFWPNEFDFCPDFLRHYQSEGIEELAEKKQ